MLNELIEFIHREDGINDKNALAAIVSLRFSCTKDRSVYYTNYFAIRFCKAGNAMLGNTILSLSA